MSRERDALSKARDDAFEVYTDLRNATEYYDITRHAYMQRCLGAAQKALPHLQKHLQEAAEAVGAMDLSPVLAKSLEGK